MSRIFIMSRTIDYLTLIIITFLVAFAWSGYLTSNYLLAAIIAVAFSTITFCTAYYVKSQKTKPYDYERLALELSIRGNEYLIKLLLSTLKNNEIENGSNYIVLDDSIIIAAFRFSHIGINDIGNIFSLALEKERKRIFVLARGIDRKASNALQTHGIKLTVIRIRAIYRYLEKNNALPVLTKNKSRPSLKSIISTTLSHANTKHFFFSGAILISFAFLTPLRIYYLVFGSITLLLALLTLTPLGSGNFNSDKLFERLEEYKKEDVTQDDNGKTVK